MFKIEYYKLNKVVSYNRLINMIIGARGIGKTYSLKERVINRFKKNKEKFIYFRRYSEEIKSIKDKLFDDCVKLLEENEFITTQGNEIFLMTKQFDDSGKEIKPKKEKIGDFLYMAKSQSIKSASFVEYTTFIFDEFLIEDNIHHYFSGEVENNFISIVSTIVRNYQINQCCKFFLLANSCTKYNPYFEYFHINNLKNNKQFYTEFNKQIVVEYVQNDVYVKQIQNTPFYDLIKDTSVVDYIVNNNFYLDDETSFIMKNIPEKSGYIATIIADKPYGLYYSPTLEIMWFNDKADMTCRNIWYATIENMKPNVGFIKMSGMADRIKYYYRNGCLFYNSVKTRNTLRKVIDTF